MGAVFSAAFISGLGGVDRGLRWAGLSAPRALLRSFMNRPGAFKRRAGGAAQVVPALPDYYTHFAVTA